MDDPFIPQRGRRTLQLIHGAHKSDKTPLIIERNAKIERTQSYQHPKVVTSNAYFLPLGHQKVADENGDVWKTTPY